MTKASIALKMNDSKTTDPWRSWQLVLFRFFFIFISVQTLIAYNPFNIVTGSEYFPVDQFFDWCTGPVSWMDLHFFHLGYDPTREISFFTDSNFGWLFLIFLFFISILSVFIWTVLDRRRKNYDRLHYWFRVYLSYYLFLAIASYAIEKIIPIQMPYPDVNTLLTPIAYSGGKSLAWTFLGARPAYLIFTGICEFVAVLLVLFRRTRVMGTLFLAIVLVNIVCLNLFYNIRVKLLSMHLLLVTLFLLAPFVPRLIRLFCFQESVSMAEKRFIFSSPLKKYLLVLLLIAPSMETYHSIQKSLKWYKKDKANLRDQKIYEVTDFFKIRNPKPISMSDPAVWEKLTFSAIQDHSLAMVYSLHGKTTAFEYSLDTLRQTLSFHTISDTTTLHQFYYDTPVPGKLVLTRKWMDEPVEITMKEIPIDSLRLNKEKITWIP